MFKKRGIIDGLLAKARSEKKKLMAVLIDPDKWHEDDTFYRHAATQGVDLFLVGGSLLMADETRRCVRTIQKASNIPVYLFPSSPAQIVAEAEGILFLSLVSGRNSELLIGKQVEAAPILAKSNLHVFPTAYALVDCGNTTTAHYMSQSMPIPYKKNEIAQATALAAEMLGFSCLYMDGGSGAEKPISANMIKAVREASSLPLIIGGGIRNPESARAICQAGADMVVVGTLFEEDPLMLYEMSRAVHGAYEKESIKNGD